MNDEVTTSDATNPDVAVAPSIADRSNSPHEHTFRFAIVGTDRKALKLAISLLLKNTQITIITKDDQEARMVLQKLGDALSKRASNSTASTKRDFLKQVQVTPELERVARHNLIFVFQDASDVNSLAEQLVLLEAAASRETPIAVCLSLDDDPTLTMATAPNPNRVVPVYNLLPDFEAAVLFPVDTQLCRVSCLERVIDCFNITGHMVFPLNIENARSQLEQVVASWVMEGLRWLEQDRADIRTIDRLFRSATVHHLGPLQLADFIGLDFVLSAVEGRAHGDDNPLPIQQLKTRVAAGDLGWKSGRGFYNYSPEPDRP